jgi:hypothetical protein
VKRVHASTAKANAGVRYITGMDGIRRAVPVAPREAALSPRTVLQNMTAAAAMAMRPLADAEPVFTGHGRRAGGQRLARAGLADALGAVAAAGDCLWAGGHGAGGLDGDGAGDYARLRRTAHGPGRRQTSAAPAAVAPTPAVQAPAVAPTPQKTGLQQILDDFVAANGSHFEIVVKDLKTGETATLIRTSR